MSAHLIEERAATWLMRREEPDWSAGDAAALEAWLAESMAHRAAFWRLEEGWGRADRLRAVALAPRPASNWPRRRVMGSISAVAACIALAVGFVLWDFQGSEAVHTVLTTGVGEHRVAALGDGSRLELNTGSLVRADIRRNGREVWLDRGEAYFEVAHDKERPFVVHAGDTRITVLGTKFVVRREADRVTVGVVEGRVKVEEVGARARDRASVITAGDMALTQDRSMLLAPRSERRVEAQLAWRDGRVSFENATLGQAAQEFNRYNSRQLVIAANLQEVRIGGSFEARNLDGFVRMLREAYGLSVAETETGYTISS
ncbi:FecR domain-containing protein [Brevundimonas sp.]|uniref:FecR family protein n=1 Tax=Brevundimonas sp. TaxID=1871086 RepID=UPI00289BAF7A|nr:FecR domain-containing protein [Brevundimonas sp.]